MLQFVRVSCYYSNFPHFFTTWNYALKFFYSVAWFEPTWLPINIENINMQISNTITACLNGVLKWALKVHALSNYGNCASEIMFSMTASGNVPFKVELYLIASSWQSTYTIRQAQWWNLIFHSDFGLKYFGEADQALRQLNASCICMIIEPWEPAFW